MKKYISIFVIFVLICLNIYSQSNASIDINDSVYKLLDSLEIQGYCSILSNVRPYSQKYIITKLEEAYENIDELEDSDKKTIQLEIISTQLNRFNFSKGWDELNSNYRFVGGTENFPTSLNVGFGLDGFISGGLYSNKNTNSIGYETWVSGKFDGDLGKNVSYKQNTYINITWMNQKYLGTYDIGYWWYDNGEKYESTPIRYINIYRNYSVLPYSYKKQWDGSVYYLLGGVNAEGLTGWPFYNAFGFGMQGEVRGTFFDDILKFSIGRNTREWGAMDKGSSLVLNANAHPFFAVESEIHPFEWIKISSITGFLEFPNQEYINSNAWYITDGKGNRGEYEYVHDSYFYHNILALGMLDFDLKYFHFDFGSSVILPNRFEMGYSFPLIDRVVYQNNVGDYDNLALFANLKLRYPGLGYVWGSFYLDEMNSLNADIFNSTRCMFSYQAGAKANLDFLPNTTLSLRYTKIEPYCYTHQALSSNVSQPYYPSYISESYTNNGESLGYYLPPNSDELNVKIESNFLNNLQMSFSYQLIRHGVDWGSDAKMYSGSSIYSELPTGEIRKDLRKYFLQDGTYEWMNIFNLCASYDLKSIGLPFMIYSSIGYIHNWFTTVYDEPGVNTNYYFYNVPDYLENRGCVISVGFKAFKY